MKLNTQAKSVQSAGMSINVDFSIDMNGKAFNVLSSGMYSEIESTIVRELCSNAYDAHIAAGKPEVPFEVSCPSAFDPHFEVKDFGTGLRYFKHNANIVNEHEGESTIFIDGDIRKEIEGINMVVLGETETVNIGAILYDNTNKQTVLRVPGDFSGKDVAVEFDDTLVLYSTYFRSTKEQSNDFTGAFGLGSKTPLAYTDNFIVTNRYNGIKRVYNILTNEHGMPQINLMMTVDTDEDNGLEVKIAVAPDDYHTFKKAIVDQLKYFDPLPVVLNDEVEFPKVAYKGEHFILFEEDLDSDSWNKGFACVGNNAYNIRYLSNNLFQQNLVARFDIGEVMVTASREDLQYDDDTIAKIQEREREAMDEYTGYVLDSIDDDSMTDYEKAVFLNRNFSIVDLSSKRVRKMVGNPNFRYSKNAISLPLTGWGDYTSLKWIDIEDDQGNVETKLANHGHYRQYKLRWSEYNEHNGKTSRLNSDVFINPTESRIVFIRDNSYSFLKKIKFYLEENGLQGSEVLTLDTYDDDALEMLEEVVDDNLTLVYLSSIELPKNISTVAYGSNTTPVARMFKHEKHSFGSTKYWTDVYTPLTKIDTDAYIIQTHRCEIEGLEYDDLQFIQHYLNSEMDFDHDNTVILALSRARYDKALTYGFKPIQDLIKELRENVEVPVDLVNRNNLIAVREKIRESKVVSRIESVSEEEFDRLDENHPVRTLIRFKKLFNKRYPSAKFEAIQALVRFMGDSDLPEPSDFVAETVDKYTEMVDNVNSQLKLLDHVSSPWYSGEKEEFQKAVIDYANVSINTGENK